jgi:hypothetical protein
MRDFVVFRSSRSLSLKMALIRSEPSIGSSPQLSKALRTKWVLDVIDRRAEAPSVSDMASGSQHMTVRVINHPRAERRATVASREAALNQPKRAKAIPPASSPSRNIGGGFTSLWSRFSDRNRSRGSSLTHLRCLRQSEAVQAGCTLREKRNERARRNCLRMPRRFRGGRLAATEAVGGQLPTAEIGKGSAMEERLAKAALSSPG